MENIRKDNANRAGNTGKSGLPLAGMLNRVMRISRCFAVTALMVLSSWNCFGVPTLGSRFEYRVKRQDGNCAAV